MGQIGVEYRWRRLRRGRPAGPERRDYQAALAEPALPADTRTSTPSGTRRRLPGAELCRPGPPTHQRSSGDRDMVDPNRQKEFYREFQELFAEEVPAILLYQPVYTYGVDQKIQNVQMGPLMYPSDRLSTLSSWYIATRRTIVSQCGAGKAIDLMRMSRSPSSTSTLWRRNLWVIWFAQFTAILGFSSVVPILPFYVQQLGVTDPNAVKFWSGAIFSAHAITMAVMAPIWGTLADRYGRKPMVERAMSGGAVAIGLMSLARTPLRAGPSTSVPGRADRDGRRCNDAGRQHGPARPSGTFPRPSADGHLRGEFLRSDDGGGRRGYAGIPGHVLDHRQPPFPGWAHGLSLGSGKLLAAPFPDSTVEPAGECPGRPFLHGPGQRLRRPVSGADGRAAAGPCSTAGCPVPGPGGSGSNHLRSRPGAQLRGGRGRRCCPGPPQRPAGRTAGHAPLSPEFRCPSHPPVFCREHRPAGGPVHPFRIRDGRVTITALSATLASLAPAGRQGTVYGLESTFTSLANAIGPMLSTTLAVVGGLRMPFLGTAACFSLAGLATAYLVRERQP